MCVGDYMQSDFINPFDLSSYDHSEKFYHWCIFDNEQTLIQNKDLQSVEAVKNDILSKKLSIKKIKVIRTIEPFKAVLNYFNKIDINVCMLYDDESLFVINHPFLVDVTNEVIKLLNKN